MGYLCIRNYAEQLGEHKISETSLLIPGSLCIFEVQKTKETVKKNT